MTTQSHMKHLKLLALAVAGVALGGCEAITDVFSGDCTSVAIPGISVVVLDSLSGAGIASGAMVRVRDGSFADSVSAPDDVVDYNTLGLYLAYERPGVYQVTVTRQGYRSWSASNVRVKKDGCHVSTAMLTARLFRLP